MKLNKILLAILIVGGLLRLIGLSFAPAGFTPDEASFGYDAYSLIHTGRDQWGNAWPLVLRSFGDGKMPLYSYLSIPFVYALGLNVASVRFPNALLGTLAILAVFLLTKEIKDKKTAYVASFLLAVSPWHIPLSRGAFEANLTTFFLPIALYFYYKGFKSRRYFYLAGLLAGLNLFTYHSARIVTPIVFVGAIWFSRNRLKTINKQAVIVPCAIFGMFLAVAMYTYLFGAGGRLVSSSIISSAKISGDVSYYSSQLGLPHDLSRLLHNKIFYSASLFVKNYLDYFSTQFMFTEGPAEGTYGMVPGIGTLYLTELLFLGGFLVGAIKRDLKLNGTLLLWLLAAPIPAALSSGPGRAANRAAVMMPVLQMFLALGAVYLYDKYRNYLKFYYARLAVVLIVLVSVMGALENFVVLQRYNSARAMLYGTEAVFSFIKRNEGLYRRIIITNKISEPHIYAAFYMQVDPYEYQLASTNWDFETRGFGWVDQLPKYSLGKYTFKTIDWVADPQLPGVLIVAAPGEFPENTAVSHTVYYPNGKIAYIIIDPQSTGFAYRYEDE